MDTKWHDLLIRQLKRSGLTVDNLPIKSEEWLTFLQKVNRSYTDTDQERYLLERSMSISSREMSELNKKLENAQHIACLGYWDYSVVTGKVFWSRELRLLFGFNATEPIPNFEDFLPEIHEEDKKILTGAVEQAVLEGKEYDIELRIRHKKTHEFRWFRSICCPYELKGKVHELSGVAMDITARKLIETEMAALNNKLLDSARSVGMAEVATEVLHNVGNVLNSVNVSIGVVQEKLKISPVKKVQEVLLMLKESLKKTNFLANVNEKEQLLPQYLVELGKVLEEEQSQINKEMRNLLLHIQHINDIISSQQSLGKVAGIVEKLALPELVDVALQISSLNWRKGNIQINKLFDKVPIITSDKSKLLQILVNILQNAQDSVVTANPPKKMITLGIKSKDENNVEIMVQDNGLGILPENLSRIFAFGFTTKPTGHGFGLHMSALTAQNLGGSLCVESEGLGHGAVFKLTLPVVSALTTGEVYNEQ